MGRKYKQRMIPEQDRRICGSICFCQFTIVISCVALVYLSVAIYMPSHRAFNAGIEPNPVMCQTVNATLVNYCAWASCGEWCLTKTTGFCPQIHATVRRNGTDLLLQNCTKFTGVPCPQVNLLGLKRYNCNNGSECSTLAGVFNCSLGHCANMSELMLCHHKADGIVIDSEKDNMKLNGFFSCQNSRCTKIKRPFSCDRYCPKISTSNVNVFLMQDDNIFTARCERGFALNRANGNLPGTRLIEPEKVWDEGHSQAIIASCFRVAKDGTNIRTEDCVNGTLVDESAIPQPYVNFTTFLTLYGKSLVNPVDPTNVYVPSQRSLTIYNTSRLYINLEGCVNTLRGECRDFLASHGRDGDNHTAQSRYPCFYNKTMEWLTLILTILVGIIGIHYFFMKKFKKLEQLGILHRKPWPVLGNLAPAFFRQCSLMDNVDQVYRMNEDASYVGFYNMFDPIIMLRSPELIKSIAIKNADHFIDHCKFLDPDLDPLLGKTLFGLCGEKWKEVRNVLSPAFTSSKMKSMFHLMSKCAADFTDHLTAQAVEKPSILETKEAFTRYTNDVIATCAFGLNVDSMKNPNNDFYVMGKKATNFEGWRGVKLFFLNSFPKISKLMNLKFIDQPTDNYFTSVVKETMDTRDREGITRPDMLQLMMDSRGNKSADGSEFAIQEMTAQAFGFFFAGFETVSTTMCFTAYEIAVNEDIQQKLQEEVDEIMAKTNGDISYEVLNEMQYLDAVINESMRLHPAVPINDRMCVKKFELPPALPGGKPVIVEPGQNMWFISYCLHRDPKYFPDPLKFDPDRFMGSRKNDIEPSTYFPFGLGPRMCLGNRFALLEMKIMLFYLLSKCHLKPSPKTRVPLELCKSTLAMVPEGGFWIQLEPRSSTEKVMEH